MLTLKDGCGRVKPVPFYNAPKGKDGSVNKTVANAADCLNPALRGLRYIAEIALCDYISRLNLWSGLDVTAGLLAILHKITGGILVLFGMVLLPMPIPLGLVLMVLGLALLAPYFVPIQRVVRQLRKKYPKVDDTMRRLKHKCPPVIKSAIEKTCPKTTTDDMPAA